MKDPLVRFSVAIGGELLQKFDQYREMHRYPNRSEAVRGLMRAALIEDVVANDDSEAMGVVTLIYNHHAGRVAERLTELQHLHLNRVVTTTHVHLDALRCLEVILLRGPAKLIRDLADSLIGTKGVETGRLVLSSAAPIPADTPHPHAHPHPEGTPHPHPHGEGDAPSHGSEHPPR
ncbi:MAG: nickel-responsive transcriptional regulator NikR [Planctomycetaceae bacterium]|jgi:CopG family transcriptional regulator, nickel-responsive regulator|nr:nickel-responsive transcriptional regulator NikR [Planctomycetaceae bacterium]